MTTTFVQCSCRGPAWKVSRRCLAPHPHTACDTQLTARLPVHPALRKVPAIAPLNLHTLLGHTKLPTMMVDLIDRLTCYAPHMRLTARQALQHPFFAGQPENFDETSVAPVHLNLYK